MWEPGLVKAWFYYVVLTLAAGFFCHCVVRLFRTGRFRALGSAYVVCVVVALIVVSVNHGCVLGRAVSRVVCSAVGVFVFRGVISLFVRSFALFAWGVVVVRRLLACVGIVSLGAFLHLEG